jgi:hypothetical protein
MDQISTLEPLFPHKERVNDEILATMRLFDSASPVKGIRRPNPRSSAFPGQETVANGK